MHAGAALNVGVDISWLDAKIFEEDQKKINNLIKAAQQYLIENKIEGCDLRFDVVTFVAGELEHYPAAFEIEEN